MPCPITSLKFVGTISLGLLTGVSYTLTSLTLPSLACLPSATHAARTLRNLQIRSTRTILSLASITSLSLLTSFWLASPRRKHPYLVWVALASFIGGQGIEGWYNGVSRFPKMVRENWVVGKVTSITGQKKENDGTKKVIPAVQHESSGDEWDMMASVATDDVNGETVEMDMARERWIQGLRTGITGLGFTMAVIGIWGDGA
ncbi:hypothetical protein UCRPC4_g02442 [Phaeomoniella chlamydospora]|uniref:Autophagy-related protein 33 n=1 Tax=Phaeomoniella chlamydospora TaxID=158046 RepID=A0A0G2EQC9_PHACM|nr:hypothetical protein UCRPC4_g02442 [Phaeomoniella chlamydospora]